MNTLNRMHIFFWLEPKRQFRINFLNINNTKSFSINFICFVLKNFLLFGLSRVKSIILRNSNSDIFSSRRSFHFVPSALFDSSFILCRQKTDPILFLKHEIEWIGNSSVWWNYMVQIPPKNPDESHGPMHLVHNICDTRCLDIRMATVTSLDCWLIVFSISKWCAWFPTHRSIVKSRWCTNSHKSKT